MSKQAMIYKRVLISGAGIGGMALATALARRGIEVQVVERRQQASAIGVGIIQHCNAVRVLQSLSLLQDCQAAGFQADERRYHDESGKLIVSAYSARSLGPDIPAFHNVPRVALQGILERAALEAGTQLRTGDTIAAITQDSDGVDVAFGSGASARYDLVVGADGIRSGLRRLLFGNEWEPQFTGFGFWRVTVPRLPKLDFMGMYHGSNSTKAGLVPLTGETMYLFLVSNEPANVQMDPASHLRVLREYLAPYGGDVGAVRDMLNASHEIVYSPAEQVLLPQPWYVGRALLIGDAAHAGMPHLAQGAAMALEDAYVLDELVGRQLPAPVLMESFMQRRYERCLYSQRASLAIANSEQHSDFTALSKHHDHLRESLPGIWRSSDMKLGAQP